MGKTIASFMALLFGFASLVQAADWTVKDLDALNQKGQYQEVLDKADSVPPTARDKQWDAATLTAFENLAQKKMAGERNYDTLSNLLSYMEKYPHLENSNKATAALSPVIADNLDKCMSYGYWEKCTTQARKMAAMSSTSAEQVWKMGEAVSGSNYPGEALPFLAQAFQKGLDKKKCNEIPVEKALRFGGRNPDAKIYDDFRKLAFEYCPDIMSKSLIAELTSKENQLKAMCPDLLKYGKVAGVLKTKCERVKQ